MAQTTLDDLRKEYEDVVAVDDFSLTLEDGEFLVLLGPSGCGKSTTLRMTAGLEDATSGHILVDGEQVDDQAPAERDFAMVFQQVALYPHMSVHKNISSPLRAAGVDADTINDRVERTARMLDIGELLDRKPSELSGGQQQRVAIGRALVREPRAFLLDEPFSKLDQKLRTGLQKELKRLQEQTGVTTMFVTHDQEEAMVLADRIAIMNEGELQQIDTPERVYRKPANQFVADFIGNPVMNFFDVTPDDAVPHIEGIPHPDAAGVMPEGARSMAARPEDASIVPAAEASSDDRLTVEVDLVEMRGSTTYLICDFEGREVTFTQSSEGVGEEGDTPALEFDFDAVNFFDERGDLIDPATEQNVQSIS